MAVTITTQTVNGANVVIAEQTGGTGVAIAIDYSFLYDRIADTLDNISANVASIKTSLDNISANTQSLSSNVSVMRTTLSNVAANLAVMSNNSTIMKNYGTGSTETFTYSGNAVFATASDLSGVPSSELVVTVNNVKTTNYTVNSSAITLTSTPDSGASVRVSAYGKGIHTTNPFDSFGAISLYRLYAEEGEILKTGSYVSDEKEAAASKALTDAITKVEPFRQF